MSAFRILHLLAPAPFGGLESVVHSLAVEQAAAGYDVHVGAIIDRGTTDHPFVSAVKASGIAVHALEIPPRAYRHESGRVKQLYSALRPNIVHTHGYRADVLHGPLARRMKIAWVATSHGFTGGGWKNRVYESLQRRAFRYSSAVIAVSRPMADQLKAAGVREDRLYCIPNAWTGRTVFLERAEARSRLGIPDDEFCAGFIGRLGIEKGPDVFLRAIASVRDNSVKAVLVGDGALRNTLQEETEKLNLQNRVTFAGRVDGAGRLIRAFDVVVLSSRTEGTPVVLLEAMAAGVPVIATRVGGIPDVVSEQEAVLLEKEDFDAIASAILDVQRDRGSAAERARRAHDRLATQLNAGTWIDRHAAVYSRSTSSRSTGISPARYASV